MRLMMLPAFDNMFRVKKAGCEQVRQRSSTKSDPTLLHEPANAKEEVPKEGVLQNVSLTFGQLRDQLATFPANQAVCGIFMHNCMWVVLHPS